MGEYEGKQYVGIDLHRQRSVVVRMTPEGERIGPMIRIDNDPLTLAQQVASWGEAPEVVLEATYGWYWAADVLAGEKYAVGAIVEGDYRHLRERLMASAPNGHELDSPWSTYAQDALICLDAALAASSVSASEALRPNWIQYALEPLATSLVSGITDYPSGIGCKSIYYFPDRCGY